MIVTAPARSAPQNTTRPVLEYQSGFGNVHGTEAVPGALPVGQNAPQRPPNRLRWNPLPIPKEPADFLDELITLAGSGEPAAQAGVAVHIYRANRSMSARYFVDSDGELMFVPQLGEILIFTELGKLCVAPGEIGVVPRGIKFKVELLEKQARG